MKQLIFLTIGFILLSSCKNQQQEKTVATLYDTLYQPAVVVDLAVLVAAQGGGFVEVGESAFGPGVFVM